MARTPQEDRMPTMPCQRIRLEEACTYHGLKKLPVPTGVTVCHFACAVAALYDLSDGFFDELESLIVATGCKRVMVCSALVPAFRIPVRRGNAFNDFVSDFVSLAF